MEPGTDAAERFRALCRAHEAFVTGADARPPGLREVVAESWRRSADARVTPDGMAPIGMSDAELAACRDAHPLARVVPLFRELLGGIAQDGAHLLAVSDERGRLLWVEGHPGVRRQAERMNFTPGAQWDERHAGTNAPGTALSVDHPVQIFAAEHFSRAVQQWTCAAAPVHDPRSGRLLGAVDITGGDQLAHPHSLALVQATARAAEAHLATLAPAEAWLTALGRNEALLTAGGRRLRLGRRHSEIVVLLACHPEGLTGDHLALELYGDRPVNPVTLRAELSRLRQLLGPLLASRPYRLREPVRVDVGAVADAVAAGDPATALDLYRGPLLPLSEAPGVVRLRRAAEDRLRGALLARGDPALLVRWADTAWGENDLEVWEAVLATAPAHGATAARVATLRAAYGLSP